MEVYTTLDNGGNPFTVAVSGNKIKVYLNGSFKHRTVVFTSDIEAIFVGKSILNKMTEFSGAEEGYEGNSILVKLPDGINKYVYIGESIYQFTSYAKIVEYYSPIGNSSVPYPYAIDEVGNYYLMIENVVLDPKPEIIESIQQDGGDPYDYYYDNNSFKLNMLNNFPLYRQPIVANFDEIKEFKIGDETYNLNYHPYPEKDFDDLKHRLKVDTLSIIKQDDTEVELTKELYIDLNQSLGELIKVKPIMEKVMIHDRV